MKYFILSNSADEKIIGKKYPQCKGLPSSLGLTSKWFEQPNSMTKLTNDEFPIFEPELVFELEEKAILTDVVSPTNISAKGLLINEKVKNIFSSFNLMEHKYYPATLIADGIRLNYFWLHFKENLELLLELVDFEKSIFYIGNLAGWKIKNIEIKSKQDYYKIKSEIGFKTINFEILSFIDSKKNNIPSLFYIGTLHNDYLIKSEVIELLKSNNIQGIELAKPKFKII